MNETHYIELVIDDHNASQRLLAVDAALGRVGPTATKQAAGLSQFEQATLKATAAGQHLEKESTSIRSKLGDLYASIDKTRAGLVEQSAAIQQWKVDVEKAHQPLDALARGMTVAGKEATDSSKMIAAMGRSGRDAMEAAAAAAERASRPLDAMARGLSAAGKEASSSGRLIAGMAQSGREAADAAQRAARPLDAMARGMSAAGKEATSSGRMIAGMSAAGRDAAAVNQKLAAANERVSTSTRLVDRGMASLGTTVKQVFAGFTLYRIVDLAARSIVNMGREAFTTAGELTDMAAKTDLSTDTLQEFQYIAKQTGGTLDNFTEAAFRLGVRIAGGSNSVVGGLRTLKLSLDEIRHARPDEQMWKVVTALGAVQDAQERNRLGVLLFGKSYSTIASAVAQDMAKLRNEAPKMPAAQIKALDDAADAWDRYYARIKKTVAAGMGEIAIQIDRANQVRDMVTQLPQNQRMEFLRRTNPDNLSQDPDFVFRDLTGKIRDEVLPAAPAIDTRTAVERLRMLDAEIAKLTKTQQAEIAAELALGTTMEEIEDKLGLSTGAMSRYSAVVRAGAESDKQAARERKAAGKDLEALKNDISELNDALGMAERAGLSFDRIVEKYGDTLADTSEKALIHGLVMKDLAPRAKEYADAAQEYRVRNAIRSFETDGFSIQQVAPPEEIVAPGYGSERPSTAYVAAAMPVPDVGNGDGGAHDRELARYDRLNAAEEEYFTNSMRRRHEFAERDIATVIDSTQRKIDAADREIEAASDNEARRATLQFERAALETDLARQRDQLADRQLQHQLEVLETEFAAKVRDLAAQGELYTERHRIVEADYLEHQQALTEIHKTEAQRREDDEEERRRREAAKQEQERREQTRRAVGEAADAWRFVEQVATGSLRNIAAAIALVTAMLANGDQGPVRRGLETITDKGASASARIAGGLQVAGGFASVAAQGENFSDSIQQGDSRSGRATAGMAKGAQMGMAFGPQGALIGAGWGALVGALSDPAEQGREAARAWGKQLADTFDVVATSAQRAEVATATLQARMSGGMVESTQKVWVLVRDGYLKTGQTEDRARQSFERFVQAAQKGPEAVARALKEINEQLEKQNQLLDAEAKKRDMLRAAVGRYNIPFDQAGAGFQAVDLAQRGEQIHEDWQLLTKSGMDVQTTISYMRDAINGWFRDAKRAGVEIPHAMRPMLEAMTKARLLTDENGRAYGSLEEAGVKFGDSLTTMWENVLKKLEELILKLTAPLPNYEIKQTNPVTSVYTGEQAKARQSTSATVGSAPVPTAAAATAPPVTATTTVQSTPPAAGFWDVQPAEVRPRFHAGGIVQAPAAVTVRNTVTERHVDRFHSGGIVGAPMGITGLTGITGLEGINRAPAVIQAPTFHIGGIVAPVTTAAASVWVQGSGLRAQSTMTPAMAAAAPRFHSGGVIRMADWKRERLASNEVPIIAERGEGVLARPAMAAIGVRGFEQLNRGDVAGFVKAQSAPATVAAAAVSAWPRFHSGGIITTSAQRGGNTFNYAGPVVATNTWRSGGNTFSQHAGIATTNRWTHAVTNAGLGIRESGLGTQAGLGVTPASAQASPLATRYASVGERHAVTFGAGRRDLVDVAERRAAQRQFARVPAVPPAPRETIGVHVDVGGVTVKGGTVPISEREFSEKLTRTTVRKMKARGVRFGTAA